MKYVFTICVVGLQLMVGCVGKPFQPIPPLFMMWSKQGADSEDVKHALTNCGFENIGTGFDVGDMRTGRITQNEFLRAEVCMEKGGFENSSGRAACSYSFNAKLPACREN